MTTQTAQDKLDALIAAAMHCKARRADPAYSFEGLEVAKAYAAIHACDEANEIVADMQAELDEEYPESNHHAEYMANMEMRSAAIRCHQRKVA